jgi:hypothetical protein
MRIYASCGATQACVRKPCVSPPLLHAGIWHKHLPRHIPAYSCFLRRYTSLCMITTCVSPPPACRHLAQRSAPSYTNVFMFPAALHKPLYDNNVCVSPSCIPISGTKICPETYIHVFMLPAPLHKHVYENHVCLSPYIPISANICPGIIPTYPCFLRRYTSLCMKTTSCHRFNTSDLLAYTPPTSP